MNPATNKNKSTDKSLNANGAPARLQAMWWLTSVIQDGRSVNDLLANNPAAPSESAFAKQLLFGSLRYYHQLKAILDQLISKPLKQKDSDVYSILILGVYQLRYLSTPDHAALSESVELTRKIKKSWASGLVNGILRNYQRQVLAIEEKLQKAKTFQYSHPNWIINQIENDWGDQYKAILEANNQKAPMTIRVNQSVVSSADYIKELNEVKLNACIHEVATDGLVLENACDVYQLPGFEQGRVSVQDAAAQLVVDLLDLKPGIKVLDGCAAPGGKTTHILQRQPNVELTSVEMSENRLKKIEQTLERLGFQNLELQNQDLQNGQNYQLKCADILNIDEWWDGKGFDRILIDVPCSASGVIRRNPDIKIHRKKQDLTNIVELQANILAKVWTLLKPGGRLVYATCSIFKDENENQIIHFLKNHSATIVRLSSEKDTQLKSRSEIGHQIFPGDWQMDGFYLCGLIKPL